MEKLLEALRALSLPSTQEFCLFGMQHWYTCMSKSEWSGWAQAFGAVLGIAAAVLAPILMKRSDRKAARQGCLEMVAVDVKMAHSFGEVYLRGKIISPAYRVPLHGAVHALPSLLADGCLTMTEATKLALFYEDVESFNRCLDLTMQLRAEGRPWQGEGGRNRRKAQVLIPKELHREFKAPPSRPSRYDDAMEVLKLHLPAKVLERMEVQMAGQEDEDDSPPPHTQFGLSIPPFKWEISQIKFG